MEIAFERLSALLDIVAYFEFYRIDNDAFMEKYGYLGNGISNHAEIRFYTHEFAMEEVRQILQNLVVYHSIPVTGTADLHFIVFDESYEWILIKNNYNKIIALGDIMKRALNAVADRVDMKRVMHIITG